MTLNFMVTCTHSTASASSLHSYSNIDPNMTLMSKPRNDTPLRGDIEHKSVNSNMTVMSTPRNDTPSTSDKNALLSASQYTLW